MVGNLVLSRKLDEVICVGDDITITVVEIRSDKVKLSIKAPSYCSVDRLEIREKKKSERTFRKELPPEGS